MRLTNPQLKVFAAVCANFVVLFLGSNVATKNFATLTINLVIATIFWIYAVKAEELLEKHD